MTGTLSCNGTVSKARAQLMFVTNPRRSIPRDHLDMRPQPPLRRRLALKACSSCFPWNTA